MRPSPDNYVLLGVDKTQAGAVVASAIVQLCELGYVKILRQRSGSVHLSRTTLELEPEAAPWIHDTLTQLFDDPNNTGANVVLGDPLLPPLPIAPGLLHEARKRLEQAGLIRRLRPRSVLLAARTFGVVAWLVTFALVPLRGWGVFAAFGICVAGIIVWLTLFMCYLDNMGQRRVFYTREGKDQAIQLGTVWGVQPNATPYEPIELFLDGDTKPNKLRWQGNVQTARVMSQVMSTMATALNPHHELLAQSNATAKMAKAS